MTSGAYVSSVTSGSGAANAGIQVGDVITKFEDTNITSASDLMLAIRAKNPGDTVKITLYRNGTSQEVTATLGEDKTSTTSNSSNSSNSSNNSNNSNSGSSIWQYLYGNGSGSGSGSGTGA